MSEREASSDADAPEEFTAQQGLQQDEELRKVQRENKARVVREGKERRRKWAQKLTSRQPQEGESVEDVVESEVHKELVDNRGMLPDEIVKLIAAGEKKVFASDSEEEEPEKKPTSKKKRAKQSRTGPVILNEIPAPQCLQSSLEFLNKRKMQVPRSSAVLNNSNQALRLLSSSGLLCRK